MLETIQAHWILTPKSAPLSGGSISYDRETGHIQAIESNGLDPLAVEGTLFLTPGLVNAHTHLELGSDTPIPIEPGESMAHWLAKANETRKGQTHHDAVMVCQKHVMELIRTGTTCVNDVSTNGASLEALTKIGMRGVVSPEFFHPAHELQPYIQDDVDRFLQLKARYGSHPLIELGISPHSPYNVIPQAWQTIVDAVDPFFVHTHLAETRAEVEYFQTGQSALDEVHQRILGRRFGPVQSGVSPVEAMASVFNNKTVAAHGVYLTETDIELLAQKGVKLVHCPRSNHWLSGPEANMPLIELYKAGVILGIGTDSRLSNTDLDLRNEGRYSQQIYGLKSRDVFDFMTHCSAQAIGLSHRIGSLIPQHEADMVLWWHPASPDTLSDPYDIWLSPQTEAVSVWIHGRIVLERAGVLGD